MAYPDDPLPVTVEIAPGADPAGSPAGWTWVDVTSYVRLLDRITITEGTGDWGDNPDPGTCELTFQGDALSQYNPAGPYYGQLGRDTPLRVSVDDSGGTPVVLHGGWVPAWVPRYPLNGDPTLAVVPVTSYGTLGRVSPPVGTPPTRSALRRRIGATAGLLAYWPLEDEADAERAAPGMPGINPMTVTGYVEFGALDVNITPGATRIYGTLPLPSFAAGGSLTGRVLPGSSSPVAWTVQCLWRCLNGDDDDVTILSWTTPGGTYVRWDLVQDRGGVDGTYLVGTTAAGSSTVLWSAATTFTGPVDMAFTARQSGADIAIEVKSASTYTSTATAAGATLARIDEITINPDGFVWSSGQDQLIGHLRVADGDVDPLPQEQVRADWGEGAVARLARLTGEDGYTLTYTAPSVDLAMGAQSAGTPAELYRQAVAVDGGILYETPHSLGYRTRETLYNQAPAMTLAMTDLADAPALDPYNQQYRNQITANRPGGSSATAELPGVAAGTLVPVTDRFDVLTASDAQLPDQAGWRLHLAGADSPRWPTFGLNLWAKPSLVDGWLATTIGDRITVSGSPAGLPDVDVLVLGRRTVLGFKSWDVDVFATTAGAWAVAEADGEARVPADGSTLDSGITAGALSLDLTFTADNGRWTTDSANFPQDLRIGGPGGERVTASGISGTISPQAVTLSARAVNGVSRAWPAGTAVDVWTPAVAPL